jgi:glycosyltransferase involved in cell wall biosynthesis
VTATDRPLRLLFVIEGFSDIRFVVGLSEICELTLLVPARAYESSGLRGRVKESGAQLTAVEVTGGRLTFQARSLAYLLRRAKRFDLILAQEATRGALSANLAGRLRGVPVLNSLGIAAAEYFACRRRRGQISWWRDRIGNAVIRALLAVNGRLATGWLAGGKYLRGVARRNCPRVAATYYYGVDTSYYRPIDTADRPALRARLGLPDERFLIFLASRISHEKDPETVLRATHLARERGLDAAVLNLGGGYQEFVALAGRMGLPRASEWVLGRPAAHPMTELAAYYQASDVLAQASLAEGLGLSPLEAMACGVPAVATAVGGMAVQLAGHARLTPPQDPEAMAEQFLWVAANPAEARAEALRARERMVVPEWDRWRAFEHLATVFREVAATGRLTPLVERPDE